ncbi:uncharacterized protein HMPREF1541_10125 [Cyphellophora europaea CBS 101466]|uniref:Sensitive to high expression protein 9, mitochondrial n=1 Tax=Cyphellophora europaea (strain CBS 101466) TaxID=1220924 RepID=W2SB44_CYPE1|nr:uncharacterized protein HMPREF1541_10125 [Cyphellophora europaea CBS 101466]ETN45248.1 hypothetical protein HMPREF1541_10125 [Cyphellophora europaea CBS 101466]
MQQAPCRLSQTLWSAFRAAKPVSRPTPVLRRQFHRPVPQWQSTSSYVAGQVRFYSDKTQELERKVQEAKSRIDESLDSKVEIAADADTKLNDAQEATIVKTDPVASSIVEPSPGGSQDSVQSEDAIRRSEQHDPSANPSGQSTAETLRARFGHFMDNFQSHLFIASRRLNDLTGYSTIEALKNDISSQEALVAKARAEVTAARARYSAAIATRSTTQREVNDLLHRKHAWTPTDLERFTNLYRSDHANELAEVAAQKEVADAEARYEEGSTKLGRAILARYHEEQVWSDKIRQMSTWGTWGLMGLNVLLFVVFQILIEPWRRKRLVRGFEEKVELALQERDAQLAGLQKTVDSHAAATAKAAGSKDAVPTPEAVPTKAVAVAETIAEQLVDAISGASPGSNEAEAVPSSSRADIETATEVVAADEISLDAKAYPTPSASSEGVFASTASGYAYYADAFRELWSEDRLVVLTQREMTTLVLEGAVGGAALMGLIMALLRPR